MDLYRTVVSKLRPATRIRFADMFCAAISQNDSKLSTA